MYASLVNYYYANSNSIWGVAITVLVMYVIWPFTLAVLDLFTNSKREYVEAIATWRLVGFIALVLGLGWHTVKFLMYY